jgi:hypothetical protein
LAVTFDAIGTTATDTTSLPFHEIRYSWNFGEKINNSNYDARWAYGTRPGANSKDVALGPVAAHVFETPGTYTVTLTGYDGASTSTRTTTVTVNDPNTVFSNNTIYISQSGVPVPGQNGVPPGANVQQVTNWAQIATLAATYKRILLKRGDTWTVTNSAHFNNATRAGPGIIGAYGVGSRPIVAVNAETNALFFSAGANDWRVMDLDITAINLVSRPNSAGIVVGSGTVDTLLLRTDIKLLRNLFMADGAIGVYVADSLIGPTTPLDVGYAGYLANTPRVALLGSRFHGAGTHGIRMQGASRSVVSNVTVNDAIVGTPGNVFTLRGMSNDANNSVWNGLWTENVVISDNHFSGNANSLSVLRIHPQNNVNAERIRNIIVERNHVTGRSDVGSFSVSTGLTVRNNIFRTVYGTALEVRGESTVGSPYPTQSFFHNNTIYKPDTSLGNGFVAFNLIGTVSGVDLRNNLVYAPQDSAPVLVWGGALGGAYSSNSNSSNFQIKNTRPWSSVAPVAPSEYNPTGYYGAGVGVSNKVWDDFIGSFITSGKSMGALSP